MHLNGDNFDFRLGIHFAKCGKKTDAIEETRDRSIVEEKSFLKDWTLAVVYKMAELSFESTSGLEAHTVALKER